MGERAGILGMKVLGAPLGGMALCLLATALMGAAFFWPALADFGRSMVGVEDIKLFVWLFWHYDNAFSRGTDPFFAPEIFYPPGISLARTSLIPFLTIAYHLLPAAWGVFGKITALQLASFMLGGLFSFALCYRFVRSFAPAMLGSVVYNFSMFHLQTAVHHLNYAMAMPFVALFFIYYFEMAGIPGEEAKGTSPAPKRKARTDSRAAIAGERTETRAGFGFGVVNGPVRALVDGVDLRLAGMMALSLFLISLNELTVTIMTGFIVFLDIMRRYMDENGIKIESRLLPLAASVILCLAISTYFSLSGFPDAVSYVVPPLIFIGTMAFLVIGWRGLTSSELAHGFLRTAAAASLPSVAYMALIALLPSYPFAPDSALLNAIISVVPLQYLVLPTDMSAVSHFLPRLKSFSESGVFLGFGLIAALAASFVIKGAGGAERYSRQMFLLSLLFAFPIIGIGDQVVAATPFFAMPLFPMLGLLRVPARFILFAFLFASILCAMLMKRLAGSGDRRLAALALLVAAALVAERVPDYSGYIFAHGIPSFYSSHAGENGSVFLFPDLEYPTMLDEMYYQTVHGMPISYGVVSRFPLPTAEREGVYDVVYGLYAQGTDYARIMEFVKANSYTYMVVQKQRCLDGHACFLGEMSPMDAQTLDGIGASARAAFGPPVFEDDTISVYKAG